MPNESKTFRRTIRLLSIKNLTAGTSQIIGGVKLTSVTKIS